MSRPGFVAVQWIGLPDAARRDDVVRSIVHAPAYIRVLKGQHGAVELFYDDPGLIAETRDAVITATSQTTSEVRHQIGFLTEKTIEQIIVDHRASMIRNETIIYISKDRYSIDVITDTVGFSKVFFIDLGDARVFSSHLQSLHALSDGVDLPACLSFVLNGSVINNRTILRNVRTLKRACRHSFGLSGAAEAPYWEFMPSRVASRRASEGELQRALWDGIVASIAGQCSNRPVLLPLSGGIDSSVLLGVLGKVIGHRDVTCFSYVNGQAAPGSDAHVARRQAELFGYPHIDVDISRTALAEILRLNAKAGQSHRAPCLEIEGFAALKERFGGGTSTIMPFGDECFGWNRYRLQDRTDVLGAVLLRSPEGLRSVAKQLAGYDFNQIRATFDNEYGNLLQRATSCSTLNDMKDYLYLEQRIEMNILPLRTFSIAYWFDICDPFLDTQVMDVVSLLSPAQRMNKATFRRMASNFLPEVFSIPRAAHRQVVVDLSRQFARDRAELVQRVKDEAWHVPGLIEAKGIVELVESTAAEARSGPSVHGRATRTMAVALGSFGVLETFKQLRRRSSRPFRDRPARLELVTRILSLAHQVSEMARVTAQGREHRSAASGVHRATADEAGRQRRTTYWASGDWPANG